MIFLLLENEDSYLEQMKEEIPKIKQSALDTLRPKKYPSIVAIHRNNKREIVVCEVPDELLQLWDTLGIIQKHDLRSNQGETLEEYLDNKKPE